MNQSKPWEIEGDYCEGVFYGLPVFIRRTEIFKTLNGYCGVPESHPFFDKNYNEIELIDIEVHGGLTFSSGGTHGNFGFYWWFGFDCGHAMDYIPGFAESIGFELPHLFNDNIYRDMTYVQNECIKLAKQLSKYNKHNLPDYPFKFLNPIGLTHDD